MEQNLSTQHDALKRRRAIYGALGVASVITALGIAGSLYFSKPQEQTNLLYTSLTASAISSYLGSRKHSDCTRRLRGLEGMGELQ